MALLFNIVLYGGIGYQLLRPVDPAKYYPRYINGYQVILIKIWRVIKFAALFYVVAFILALFGLKFN